MPLSDCFDAVVMLTLSDWKTEPRSNRFHYATRFARDLPVLFVQPIAARGSSLRLEATEYPGLELVYVPRWPEELEAEDLPALLRSRRIRRPLLWIYSALRYQRVVDSLPRGFRVYHATEDYFKRSTRGYGGDDELERSLVRMLRDTNLLVAVTDGVLLSYREQGGYRGPSMVLENGCDAQFLLYLADRHAAEQPLSSGLARPAAIYQGGINARVDFALLSALTVALPDWDFWFCGRADDRLPDWTALKSRPNVRYFGELGAEALGRLMCQATVGLVPFHQDDVIRVSLPLKAYEYVSCGLPVVSVPIDALRRDVDLFTLAADAEGFADAILAAARTRHSPAHLSRRREAARRNSYDERYRELRERLITEQRSAAGKGSTLNVALLYDDRSMHVNTIREHAEAFKKYSRHAIHFVPVTGPCDIAATELQRDIDLSLFDVLILHHSVRISLADHLCEAFARQIERHMGLKILFIQDEYDSTETARRWLERLGFDMVYTCVPPDGMAYVYPPERFTGTDFLQSLTGYVPEDPRLDSYALPIRERDTLIGYRGRVLPHIYGWLGYEKYRIGVDMRRLAEARGLRVDIETDDAKRIHGTDWYRFLGSVRATLGTESGSNVFDIDGTLPKAIQALLAAEPDISFEEIHRRVLAPHEGRVIMNQVSPKIFEAIRLRTALVLFEGHYSGVVKPDVHYIPLKKDYSNIDDVFAKLQDPDFLEVLTRRAYQDVISSGEYSYRRFVERVDRDIDARVIRGGARYELFSTPVLARDRHGSVRAVMPRSALGFTLSTLPLGRALQREHVVRLLTPPTQRRLAHVVSVGFLRLRRWATTSRKPYPVRLMWKVLPERLRRYVVARLI